MRSILAIFALTIVWTFCTPLSAQPKEPVHVKFGVPEKILGGGDTIETAQQNAVKNAVNEINNAMRNHKLTAFTVDQDYVQKHILDMESGRSLEDLQIANEAPLKQWEIKVRTDPRWWNELVRRDRAEERHAIASSAMIGIAVLLLVGYGYIRLDEYTNRRFTAALRALGIAAVATALGGWWVIAR